MGCGPGIKEDPLLGVCDQTQKAEGRMPNGIRIAEAAITLSHVFRSLQSRCKENYRN